jgi:DNA mismatch endonuclease (patch repair protein)
LRLATTTEVRSPSARSGGAPWPDVSEAARKAMRANKGRDTGPELAVRRMVHAAGWRYRLHRRDLPGRPDLVFGPRRRVIFVHGCFWHSHDDGVCTAASVPKTRADYWGPKLARNRERDAAALAALADAGWRALVVWECELRDPARVRARVAAFLESGEDAAA